MTPEESQILKKIQEIEERISAATFLSFSYIQAILALLSDKGLTNQEEFQEALNKARQEMAGLMKDAEFMRLMKTLGDREPPPASGPQKPAEA
ncbi:MAG: hypothetical protein FGM27_09500 [Candidatus Omnitrophica bacterium]|nr:hypothetical protein [Candidatus Omnitrophota bacterium]